MGQPSPPRNNPLGHGSGRSSDRRMGTRSSPNGNHPPLARQTAFIEVVLSISRKLAVFLTQLLAMKRLTEIATEEREFQTATAHPLVRACSTVCAAGPIETHHSASTRWPVSARSSIAWSPKSADAARDRRVKTAATVARCAQSVPRRGGGAIALRPAGSRSIAESRPYRQQSPVNAAASHRQPYQPPARSAPFRGLASVPAPGRGPLPARDGPSAAQALPKRP